MKPIAYIFLFLTAATTLCLNQALGQGTTGGENTSPTSTYLNNFVQPPPNAGSLGKYADFPVGYYTGVPNISIPLYTLKDGGITLPISISYHASGIRVSELASWVGLGWALNATGVINRTVRGAPDEGSLKPGTAYTPRGYYEDHGLFSLLQFLPIPSPDGSTFIDQHGVPAAKNWFYQDVMPAVLNGEADTEPDLYTYNFAGHTGKFVFDEQRNVRLLEDDDIKIKVTWNQKHTNYFDSWVITTADGLQYYFGENDNHEIVLPVIQGNPDANSVLPANWYLTRIINPNTKDTVTFNYQPEGYSYSDLGPESTIYGQTSSGPQLPNACDNSGINNHGTLVSNFIKTTVVGLRLSSIVSANYTIQFVPSATPREDVDSAYYNIAPTSIHEPLVWSGKVNTTQPAYSLDMVKIYSNQNNTCLKQFSFAHSYFRSPLTTGQSVANTVPGVVTDTKRLKLDSVTEISGDNTIQKPPYVFLYQDSIKLPRRLSYDQDHWGFSNNQTGDHNNYFTPSVQILTLSGPGADRHPKWPDMSAFTLTGITDPLGAIMTFTYSPNSAWNGTDPYTGQTDTLVGGLRIKQITVTDNVTGKTKVRKFSYNQPGTSQPGGYLVHMPVYIMVPYNEYFSYTDVRLGAFPGPDINGGYIGDYHTMVDDSAKVIFKQSQGIVPMQDANGNHIVYPYVHETFGANGEGGYKTYAFHGVQFDPTSPYINSRLDFLTYVASAQELNLSMTGTGTGSSSNYTIKTGYYGKADLNDTTANPGFTPTGLAAKYSKNYNEITLEYPSVPEQVDLVGDKLVEEDTYDANNNLVTTVTNNYTPHFHENYWIRGMRGCFPLFTDIYPYNGLSFYKLHTGISRLTSTTKKVYTGSNYVVTVTKYGYESPYHTLRTSDTTTDSQGDTIINKTYYSLDYANTATSDTIFGKMKARHLIVPVRTDTWKNGKLVGEKITSFHDFATSSRDTLINPQNVYNLEAAQPLTPAQANESPAWASSLSTLLPNSYLINKVGFAYDPLTGKMTNQQLTYNRSEGIQWSSQLKLPVALVDNAMNTPSLKEFYYEGFEESNPAGLYSGNGHTGAHSVFALYTVNWALPNTRSYVISYWYFNNGKWNFQPEQAFTGSLALSGGSAFDDIRIHPVDASMVNYTYDASGDVTSTVDAKGLTVYYEYDGFQRLKNIRDKDKNIVKSYCYNYAGRANGCFITEPTYTSAQQSGTYTAQCSTGYSGSSVTYTVPAGTYSSNMSQQDADNQALTDVAANGQDYANTNGLCTINVSLHLSNSTGAGYQISFTAGTANYSFNFPNSGNSTIQVPVGTYSVSIYPTGAYVNHTIGLTGFTSVVAPRATFTNVVVSTSTSLTASIY